MWSRVESTSRVSLGVRPGHIGFSGESWSMLPGSWLTHGIGYKPTRPADWFILSATPAYACYRATTLSVCLSPVISFSLSFLSTRLLSSSLIPLSSTHRPFYSAHSVPISLVDNLSFLRRALSNSRLFRARLGSPRFWPSTKKDRLDTTLRSLTADDSAIFWRSGVEACDVRTCGKDGWFQQRRGLVLFLARYRFNRRATRERNGKLLMRDFINKIIISIRRYIYSSHIQFSLLEIYHASSNNVDCTCGLSLSLSRVQRCRIARRKC